MLFAKDVYTPIRHKTLREMGEHPQTPPLGLQTIVGMALEEIFRILISHKTNNRQKYAK